MDNFFLKKLSELFKCEWVRQRSPRRISHFISITYFCSKYSAGCPTRFLIKLDLSTKKAKIYSNTKSHAHSVIKKENAKLKKVKFEIKKNKPKKKSKKVAAKQEQSINDPKRRSIMENYKEVNHFKKY
jgi:hypothetical protein